MRLHHLFYLLVAVSAAGVARADFWPPKDGKLTDSQVTALIAIRKATSGNAGGNLDAAITKSGMTRDEYNWVYQTVSELLPFALAAKQAESAAAKANLAAYEQAQKAGIHLQTRQQHDAAVAAATSDRDSLAGEVKTDEEAIKPISDEIDQHDKDAVDAEAAAKAPPAEMSADDKSAFIDQKKNDAQAAHDAAKDGRDRLKEAKKSLSDAKARLVIADGKVNHPEIPNTDEDKAQVKTENEQAIAKARAMIADDDLIVTHLKEAIATAAANPAAGDKQQPDPDNLAIVQKHLPEYMDAIGAGDALKSK